MCIDPLGVIVENENDLILDVDLGEPFRKPNEVACTRERMTLAHVDEAEEVHDLRPQQSQRVLQDMDIRAPLGRDQKRLGPPRVGYEFPI